MVKKALLLLSCVLVITRLCFAEQPTIKTSEVERTYFVLTTRGGTIDGYLVFYDKDARQCAVGGNSGFKAKLYCGGKFDSGSFEKTLDINPSDFQWFETKGRDSYYGYIIEPFIINSGGGSTTVSFEWDSIKASTSVGSN